MRAFFAVALCFVLGACATSGEGGLDPSGIWDVVSAGELNYPNEHVSEFYFELRPDGSVVVSTKLTNGEEASGVGGFSLGEEKDGCWPINFVFGEEPDDPGIGSICGPEMTIETETERLVLHKRH